MMNMFSVTVGFGCIPGSTKTGMAALVLCNLFDRIDFIGSSIKLFNKTMREFPLFVVFSSGKNTECD